MMSGISRSKGSQAMKFGQLMEDNTRNIFLQKSCRNEAGRLAPDLFLFFKKALYEVKASVSQLSFNHFRQTSTRQTIKTKYINFRLSIQRCPQFGFFRKGSGNSFSITFFV